MTSNTLANLAIVVLVCASCSEPTCFGETGDLKMRFIYQSEPPIPTPINVAPRPWLPPNMKLKDENLVVHAENKGIKNIVVSVYTARGGTQLPPQQPSNATRDLTGTGFRFVPHIVICQAGDILRIRNNDPVDHNYNLKLFNNPSANVVLRAGNGRWSRFRNRSPQ